MNVKINKSELRGRVCVPLSKSVAHRLMIAAALAGAKDLCVSGGDDIAATARCLKTISESVRRANCLSRTECGACADTEQNTNGLPHINAGESGSTLRFLLPIVCALGLNCVFEGAGRLAQRPLGGLIKTLEAHGCRFEKLTDLQLPLKVSGKLVAGNFEIEGNVSSQYITGLLFALPLLDGDSTICVRGESVSVNYIDITLGVLADRGIEIARTADGYFVKGNQKFSVAENAEVEGDWSSAGFMIALGVLTGETRIGGLRSDSLQGDKAVVELLRRANADIEFVGEEVVARKSCLKAIDFDARDCPDAVPIMAVALSFADGVSHISHVDRLRDKESDRLGAVREMLADFGIRTEYGDDMLVVYGGRHKACKTQGFCDHRMAMSAMVCALNTDGESEVSQIGCISKSYPNFVEHVRALGADIEEI